jgi:hypothetical protein
MVFQLRIQYQGELRYMTILHVKRSSFLSEDQPDWDFGKAEMLISERSQL